jgi:hypothetical protein
MKKLSDWNKRPDLQHQLDAFMNSEAWLFADEVIVTLIPRMMRGVVIDDVTANIELGRVNGFMDFRAVMELLRKEVIPPEELKADFGTDETQ